MKTLERGKQSTGENITVRSDLSPRARVPKVELDVELPETMGKLFSLLPTVSELSDYNREIGANIKLLKSGKLELLAHTQNGYNNNQQITETRVQKLPRLELSFENSLINNVIGTAAFIRSALTIFGTNVCTAMLQKTSEIPTFFHRLARQKIPVKPIKLVEKQLN